MNPLNIQELLIHILKFIPRKAIMPCVLTCKDFLNNVLIDRNQESVAKNDDMYSLLKINYSPLAVVHIAIKYNNMHMVLFLLNRNPEIITSNLCGRIGYAGNEKLLGKLNYEQLEIAKYYICVGLHHDLIKKYDCTSSLHRYYQVFGGYAHGKHPNLKSANVSEVNIRCARMMGKVSIEDKDKVTKYVQKILKNRKIYQCYDNVFASLIVMGYYDIVKWLFDRTEKGYGTRNIYDEEPLELIIDNQYELFVGFISTRCVIDLKRVIYTGDKYEYKANLEMVALYCIDYKRANMLTFLLNKVIFSKATYDKMLVKAQELKFNDMEMLLKDNISFFCL